MARYFLESEGMGTTRVALRDVSKPRFLRSSGEVVLESTLISSGCQYPANWRKASRNWAVEEEKSCLKEVIHELD